MGQRLTFSVIWSLWRLAFILALVCVFALPMFVEARVRPQVGGQPQVVLSADATIYAWPDTQLGTLGQLPAGSVTPVTGRTSSSDWWRINYPGGPDGHGWIPASVVQADDAAYQVPVIVISFVTATPQPTPTPCLMNSSYVADVTIPDGTQVGSGQPFQKIWRMRNSGTCPWLAGTQLIFQEGTQMSSIGSVPVAALTPGQEVDVIVDMIAPQSGGAYGGIWQMRSPLGQWFGDRITVVINVPYPVPTVVIVPPPAPAPPSPQQPFSADFSADDTDLGEDECTTLHWSVTGVQAVYLEYDGKSYGVDGVSSREVCPSDDGKKYTLAVIKVDGSREEFELRIKVDD